MNDRIVLAILLLAAVFAGSLALMNAPWMPLVYPGTNRELEVVVDAANASKRVAWQNTDIVVLSGQMWTSEVFTLKKGETVTVDSFDVTPKPVPSTKPYHGVSLYIGKDLRGTGSASSSIFYAYYDAGGMTSPKECVVPETGDYEVGLVDWEDNSVSVSLRLTVKSTQIVGGVRSVEPYGKAQTLMMLWPLLGVGMLVGAACVLLVRPKQIMQPVPSPPQVTTVQPSLQTKFCRHCGAKILRDSKFCEECGTPLPNAQR